MLTRSIPSGYRMKARGLQNSLVPCRIANPIAAASARIVGELVGETSVRESRNLSVCSGGAEGGRYLTVRARGWTGRLTINRGDQSSALIGLMKTTLCKQGQRNRDIPFDE